MATVTRAIHPALRGCLAEPMVAYDVSLAVDAVHVGVPSTAATVILAIDEPLDVGWLHEPGRSTARWCSISGLHLRPALIHTHGLQRGIHLAVTPLGCHALFGVPIGAVCGDTVDLCELPRGFSAAEHESVAGKPTWPDRLALVEALLLQRLQPPHMLADMLAGWALLTRGTRVAQVAHQTGWSRRHLATKVRAEFGLSPKQITRLARFEQARQLVDAGTPMAQAANACGFADQAHLSREWKTLAGRSPSASGEEFPNLQDLTRGHPTD